MNAAGRLSLWLAFVLAAWSAVSAGLALQRARADIARHADRGLVAAGVLAWVALGVLIASLVSHDFGVRFAAARTALLMPVRYLPAAVLGAPSGALLAFAAAAGLASLVVWHRANTPVERAWVTTCAAGLMALALGVAAWGAPFARTFGYRPDGAVLSPDLQQGHAVVMVVSLWVGVVCAAAAFISTIAALAARQLGDRWNVAVRAWNAAAWCLLFVGVVAGARWHAMNPLRGPWLATPAMTAWLLPCATGAWLVHLDRALPTPERAVTRMLLVATTFIAACGAMTVNGGAFVRGMADGAEPAGRWFGAAGAAALLLTIATVRSAKGALRPDASRAFSASRHARLATIVAIAGAAALAAAALGARYTRSYTTRLADTEIFRTRDPWGRQWSFTSEGASTLRREDYEAVTYALRASRSGISRGLVLADARSYGLVDEDPSGVAAFTVGTVLDALTEVRVSVADPSLTPAALRITFVPLATWVVPGAMLVVLGVFVGVRLGGARAPAG